MPIDPKMIATVRVCSGPAIYTVLALMCNFSIEDFLCCYIRKFVFLVL